MDFGLWQLCKNLHAKCYINERNAISVKPLWFSQVNNNEMGILVRKYEDNEVFKDLMKASKLSVLVMKYVLL